jgi:hypothetical protein
MDLLWTDFPASSTAFLLYIPNHATIYPWHVSELSSRWNGKNNLFSSKGVYISPGLCIHWSSWLGFANCPLRWQRQQQSIRRASKTFGMLSSCCRVYIFRQTKSHETVYKSQGSISSDDRQWTGQLVSKLCLWHVRSWCNVPNFGNQ